MVDGSDDATCLLGLRGLAVERVALTAGGVKIVQRWRIVEMDLWDRDAIDLVEPGFIEFAGDGTGQFGFIAVRGWMDCRSTERDGRTGVEFSWDGEDDGDQIGGRGWAAVVDDATLKGHLFVHMGDDSGFRAEPYARADQQDGR